MVEKFSIWLVDLNPAIGSEQASYRPIVVLSPNSMNEDERVRYAEYAQYTKSLNEKKQTTIRYPSACS